MFVLFCRPIVSQALNMTRELDVILLDTKSAVCGEAHGANPTPTDWGQIELGKVRGHIHGWQIVSW